MKSIHSASAFTFFFMLLLTSPAEAALSSRDIAPTVQQAEHAAPMGYRAAKPKKLGFFKKMKLVWEAKKAGMRPTSEGEKASTLAKTALFLFLGGIALSLVVNGLAVTSTPIIATIAILAWLTSLVLAMIVLSGDENRKSRAIAKAVLIAHAVIVLITLVLFVAVIAALAAW